MNKADKSGGVFRNISVQKETDRKHSLKSQSEGGLGRVDRAVSVRPRMIRNGCQ